MIRFLSVLRQKYRNQIYSWYWNSNTTAVVAQNSWILHFFAINKQNNMHTTPPQTHIAFTMPHPKVIGSHHTFDNRCFNCKESHSKRNELISMVIPVLPPLNYLVINRPQMSLVIQHSPRSSQNTTPGSQAYSIPGWTSDDPSNTMP